MIKKEDQRVIPIKNYFILFAICIVTILATIYINAWIHTYKINNDVSPLYNAVQQITLGDLAATMAETNVAILYVANNDNYDLDREILNRITLEGINDYFYYMNVSGISEKEYVEVLQQNFGNDVKKVPLLIYIKNGEVKKIIDSNGDLLTINDLNVILDSYLEID